MLKNKLMRIGRKKIDNMENGMTIRTVEINDLQWLKKNEKHISEEKLETKIKNKEIFVVEEDEKMIGWLRYSFFWDNIPFINMLFLIEEHRNKGIGRKLVKYWENFMKQYGYKNVLTSTQSNEEGQHFYRKIGYTEIGGFKFPRDPYEIIFHKEIE
jgi:ribosomal protein S18 acetylase RimI-like enzyme